MKNSFRKSFINWSLILCLVLAVAIGAAFYMTAPSPQHVTHRVETQSGEYDPVARQEQFHDDASVIRDAFNRAVREKLLPARDFSTLESRVQFVLDRSAELQSHGFAASDFVTVLSMAGDDLAVHVEMTNLTQN